MSKIYLVIIFALGLLIGGCSNSGKKIAPPKQASLDQKPVDYFEQNMLLYEASSTSEQASADHSKWCYGEHYEGTNEQIPVKMDREQAQTMRDRIAKIRKELGIINN